MHEARLQGSTGQRILPYKLSYASYPQDKEKGPSAVTFRRVIIAIDTYPHSYLL